MGNNNGKYIYSISARNGNGGSLQEKHISFQLQLNQLFFIEHHFLLEGSTDNTDSGIQAAAFGKHFLENEQSESVTKGKQLRTLSLIKYKVLSKIRIL